MPRSKTTSANVPVATDEMRALLRMLSSLAQTDLPLSVDDLMREVGTSPPVAQQAIRALEAEHLVTADADGWRYVIGPRFLQLAAAARRNFLHEREMRPLLRELADASGETVTLNTYTANANSCLCLMVEHSPAPLHYVVEAGEQKPLHAGASGKVILAFLPTERIAAYVERTGLPAVTPLTTTDPEVLRAELALIREQGYGTTRGQRLHGAIAIAAPIFDGGQVYGSLVITVPEHRCGPAKRKRLSGLVKTAAQKISRLLDAQTER